MISKLLKAAIGVTLETPISILADVATLGGSLTDKKEPYTVSTLKNVFKNISDTTR
jgi:hypothetical protein